MEQRHWDAADFLFRFPTKISPRCRDGEKSIGANIVHTQSIVGQMKLRGCWKFRSSISGLVLAGQQIIFRVEYWHFYRKVENVHREGHVRNLNVWHSSVRHTTVYTCWQTLWFLLAGHGLKASALVKYIDPALLDMSVSQPPTRAYK